jgi:SOS-response transcriptional repressor LexA
MKDIGVQIRQRRVRLGWTVQKLATLAEIDRGFLSKLETGKASGSWETYIKLAGAMGISVERLLLSRSNVEDAPLDWRRIPVLDYAQASEWTPQSSMDNSETHETIMTELERPASTFALRIRGDSMQPQFLEGDVMVIDPTQPPKPGDFVVARDNLGDSTFRQYRLAGLNEKGQDVFELWPLNPLYAPMRSDRQQLAIVGTMVEHRSYRRR